MSTVDKEELVQKAKLAEQSERYVTLQDGIYSIKNGERWKCHGNVSV